MSLLLLFNQSNGTITGSLIVTDTADVVAFSGTVSISGTMTVIEIQDSVSMTGTGPVAVTARYLAPSRYDYGWYNGRPSR